MRNIKISTRLALGFGLFTLLLLLIASYGAWGLHANQERSAEMETRSKVGFLVEQWAKAEVESAGMLRVAAAHVRSGDAGAVAADRQAFDEASRRTAEIRQRVEAAIRRPEVLALYRQALAARDGYASGWSQAFKDLDAGNPARAQAYFEQEFPAAVARYHQAVEQVSRFQQDHIDELNAENQQASRESFFLLAAGAILALILGPLFAWRVALSITRPLRAAVELGASVARRDLTRDIEPRGRDEVARLEQALREMVEGLRHTVGEVQTGADTIASAAGQIAAGNVDLSSRTEEQASSLAETAATMEEITAAVRQSADNAQQADTLANNAARTATEGGAIVGELVGIMSEIHDKSRQVAEIIGVIDSIAFQTNILALNAAVEAARAGEQGRGFAVVASEVRALAQRSAASAKEIKLLIDGSAQATAKGDEQASLAGASMRKIVEAIGHVTGVISEISAASREQTTGIEEINTAVTQMDDVTRQNASLVEESAAAAASLREQADALAQLVSTFRLDASRGEPDGGAAWRPDGRGTDAADGAVRPALADARPIRLPAIAGRGGQLSPVLRPEGGRARGAVQPAAAVLPPPRPGRAGAAAGEWAEF